MEVKKEILKLCMKEGFLLDKEVMDAIDVFSDVEAKKLIQLFSIIKIKERVIKKSTIQNFSLQISNIFGDENLESCKKFFKILGIVEKKESEPIEELEGSKNSVNNVKILSSNIIVPKKIEVKDFVNYFRRRYDHLKSIIMERDLKDLKSIRRISFEQANQTIIVSILNKRITKNKNLIFDVEDLTGNARVIVNESKKEIYEKCKNLLPDEVVAFSVSGSKDILFANDVFFPDSILAERKKLDKDIWVAFSSDVHVGSSMFLENNFLKFIKWLNGEEGSVEQRSLAKKVKYLFLVGDNIDGVGVFPDQEKLLDIKDIHAQYKKLYDLLNLIRKDVTVIMCPGQHDAVWVGEPQPAIGQDWAPDLHQMENLILVTNPCLLEIENMFKILMYHGASMHGLVEEISEIRLKYGHNNPTKIVKELLKRRHLAPIHGGCDYVPTELKDLLVIDPVPDIVLTGDLHRPEVSMYNNIVLVASSCWQSITPFEEKVGNNPEPCKVPIFNLKSREIKILDFSEESKPEKVCKEGEDICKI